MVPRQISVVKSAPNHSAYDDSALRQFGTTTNRRNDNSTQRQILIINNNFLKSKYEVLINYFIQRNIVYFFFKTIVKMLSC
jgi:hypothetical protein